MEENNIQVPPLPGLEERRKKVGGTRKKRVLDYAAITTLKQILTKQRAAGALCPAVPS